MARPYRLAYLVSHPIQYQAPLLRRIAACPGIELTVFFLTDLSVRGYLDPGFETYLKWDVPLLDGYKHAFLPCLGRHDRLSFWRPLAYGLASRLRTGGFDALWIPGYAHQVYLRALIVAKALGLKVFMRGESHLSESRSPAKRWFKARVLPVVLGRVDGFLAIGTWNREYWRHYGVPKRRIFWMPYAVDNEFFRQKIEEARPFREELRAALGLGPDRPIILFAAKLRSHKRPHDLLEAYTRLSPDGVSEPRPYLLFVGDGKERSELEERVRALGWSSVRFLGFKNQSELPRYYDLCNVFVLPSEHEPWGLIVNEVMNAGKPVIVSDRVGCGPDLVQDGVNGFVVPAGDIHVLAERLQLLTENGDLARRMGEASLRIVSTWNFDTDLKGLLEALDAVVGATRGNAL